MAKKKPIKIAKDHGRELAKKVKTKPESNHEFNLRRMIERYGTSCRWVDVEMHLTHDEMIEYFGEQCEEFEPLCHNCSNWVKWHKTGKAEISFERDELLKIM